MRCVGVGEMRVSWSPQADEKNKTQRKQGETNTVRMPGKHAWSSQATAVNSKIPFTAAAHWPCSLQHGLIRTAMCSRKNKKKVRSLPPPPPPNMAPSDDGLSTTGRASSKRRRPQKLPSSSVPTWKTLGYNLAISRRSAGVRVGLTAGCIF